MLAAAPACERRGGSAARTRARTLARQAAAIGEELGMVRLLRELGMAEPEGSSR